MKVQKVIFWNILFGLDQQMLESTYLIIEAIGEQKEAIIEEVIVLHFA